MLSQSVGYLVAPSTQGTSPCTHAPEKILGLVRLRVKLICLALRMRGSPGMNGWCMTFLGPHVYTGHVLQCLLLIIHQGAHQRHLGSS